MSDQATIYHIALNSDIASLEGRNDYRCASLESEGFIHCCDRHQLLGVVSRYYSEVDDVQLLILDVDKLTPPLIHENTMGGDELFPHIYGSINKDSILNMIPFGLNSNERQGLFS